VAQCLLNPHNLLVRCLRERDQMALVDGAKRCNVDGWGTASIKRKQRKDVWDCKNILGELNGGWDGENGNLLKKSFFLSFSCKS
jgi:hypothetical protein